MRPLTHARCIEQLFHEALEVPAAEREAFLQMADVADVVRSAARSLLACDVAGEANSVVASLLASAGYGVVDEPQPGTLIGAYRLLGVLGRGGMGVVYRALPHDAPPGTAEVALKLLHTDGTDATERARFAHECRTLARLDHPGIAAFRAAGHDVSGRPFVAMELVHGRPLTEHCDAGRLDVAARLTLFLRVCDAVQAAHEQGVLHRDIKPANVLVTASGQPKLLDFGVARSVSYRSGAQRVTGTKELAPFTPGYASPEQTCGAALDLRCDVFALGVLLGELLCGHGYVTSHALRRAPSDTLIAAPEATEIAKLRATSVAELVHVLRRSGLDHLVLAATHPDVALRPASVTELVADVQRVVRGRRPHVGAARGPHVRTWPKLVSAALAATAALTLGVHWMPARATGEPPPEMLLEQLVAATDDGLVEAGARLDLRRLALRGMARRLEILPYRDTGPSREVLRALASSHERLGMLEGHARRANLGNFELAQRHYVQAIALRTRVVVQRADVHVQRELVEALTAYATLRLDSVHDLTGARSAAEQAVNLAEGHAGQAASAPLALARLRAHVLVAEIDARHGQRAGAYSRLQRAARQAAASNTPALVHKISGTLARAATLVASWGDPQAALQPLEAHERLGRQLAARPGGLRTGPLSFQLSLGDVLGNPERPNLGRPHEARGVYHFALDRDQETLRAEPRNAEATEHLWAARLRDAQALAPQAPGRSLVVARELVASSEASSGAADRGTRLLHLAACHALAGRCLRALGQVPAARREFQQALELLERLQRHPDDLERLVPLVRTRELLGLLEQATGQPVAARAAFDAALVHARHWWRIDPTPYSGLHLARLHTRLADLEQAANAPRARQHVLVAQRVLDAARVPCSGSVRAEREALARQLDHRTRRIPLS